MIEDYKRGIIRDLSTVPKSGSAEGDLRASEMTESVNLLPVPNTEAITTKDPEPSPGFKKVKYKPKSLNSQCAQEIYNSLLSLSTDLFEKVVKRGKNIASMTTPMTVCVEGRGNVDIQAARKSSITVHETEDRVLLEVSGITDTGADTNCTDVSLRKIMGRDPLPDAKVGIQGCTGINNDRKKDKLRLVTKDKEISVMEARTIQDLGYSGSNSFEFIESMKAELGIKEEHEDLFDLNSEHPRYNSKNSDLVEKWRPAC